MRCIIFFLRSFIHTELAPRQRFHVPSTMQKTKERYHYTTSIDVKNTRYEKDTVTHSKSHVRSESAREQRITLYGSNE